MTELRITVKNTSDTGGTFTTPFWFGFHDGSFDTFNSGEAASAGLEALAEDGNLAPISGELTAADEDGQTAVVAGAGGPIATGEYASMTIDVDGASNAYANYAAMILPSNDAFVGNSNATRLFSDSGEFLGEKTVSIAGSQVYDAGTEVNTEEDAAFLNQSSANTGVTEGGVVGLHPGFNGSAGNPIGEGDQNILGGTNAFGEFIDPVAADFTLPGSQIAEIHINTVKTTDGTNGRDYIWGGADDDIVNAGGGRDVVSGGKGWDVIDGGDGRDYLFGGSGDDEIFGGNGRDKIWGGRDDDRIDGGNGRDWISGGSGNDIISGGNGRDDINGGSGNDAISGGDGRDWLSGGWGDDLITGDAGNDFLRGGYGSDTFLFGEISGKDTILDFRAGVDQLAIDIDGIDSFADVLDGAEQTRRGVELDFGDGNEVLLSRVDLDWIDEGDFVFA